MLDNRRNILAPLQEDGSAFLRLFSKITRIIFLS